MYFFNIWNIIDVTGIVCFFVKKNELLYGQEALGYKKDTMVLVDVILIF